MDSLTQEQREAIAARGNVLLVAGAGTGKTTTLVNRVLDLVLHKGASLERVVLVTFTESAAAEMRRRIGETLEDALGSAPDNAAVREQLSLLPFAQIGTLHGFCLRLIRAHAAELGLDPAFRVFDDSLSLPLSAAVLDELILDRLAAREEPFRRLVLEFGRGSTRQVRDWVLEIHGHVRSLADPGRWFDSSLRSTERRSPEAWWDILRNWAQEWLSRLREAAPAMAETGALEEALVDFLRSQPPALAALVRAARDAALAWKGQGSPPFAARFIKETDFLRGYSSEPGEPDPILHDWDLLRASLRVLLELARDFGQRFDKAKREVAAVDFADQEQFALKLLRSEDGLPTRAARTLRESLDYVFVDECQDINEAQDTLIRMICREGMAANRFMVGDVKQSIYRFRRANPGIFQRYVRDWRQHHELGQVLRLTENFRSREGLIDFVNSVFSELMHESMGGVGYSEESRLVFGAPQERGLLGRRGGAEGKPLEPLVWMDWLSASATGEEENSGDVASAGGGGNESGEDVSAMELEARLVASRLNSMKAAGDLVWDAQRREFRAMEWSDVLILMRSTAGRTGVFSQELALAGIPVEVSGESFFESREIQDILQMLRLLGNPMQDIPLAAVLRSPMVGLTLEDLIEARLSEPKDGLWRALTAWCSNDPSTDSDGRKKARQFLARFSQWRSLLRQTSVSCCVDRVLRETRYEAWLAGLPRGQDQLANVRKLREMVRRHAEGSNPGLAHFLRGVELQQEQELEVESAPTRLGSAVRLMSIHKSKGLEAPVVVLAGLGKQFNKRSLRASVLITDTGGVTAKLPSPEGLAAYDTIGRWAAERAETREMLGEELRLLYVALTRARDRLVLVGKLPGNLEGLVARVRGGGRVSDELLDAGSAAHWLLLWLCSHDAGALAPGSQRGSNDLARWTIHAADAPAAAKPAAPAPLEAAANSLLPPKHVLEEVQRALNWCYPKLATTATRSKVSVTQLREAAGPGEDTALGRLLFPEQGGEEPVPFLPNGSRANSAQIGTAMHAVLEACDLDQSQSAESLRALVYSLMLSGKLGRDEGEALDLEALRRFWEGEVGQLIRANRDWVRRELPFTLKLDGKSIRTRGLSEALPGVETDDFVILQGVVDLAVILPREIWLLDFKTDRIPSELALKRALHYKPQLSLYSEALERIYARPITRLWVHLFAVNQTVDLR